MNDIPQTTDPEMLQRQACAFRDRFETVLLATVDADCVPGISYAPFVLDDDQAICIYISELAEHTRNLMNRPRASLMFISEEKDARNLFARERLVLQCHGEELRGEAARPILERMEACFGKTMELLRSLPDFHLFRFQVETGSYIRGFGQAWSLEGNGLKIRELRRG